MERSEIESYEIYKHHPEAFTLPIPGEEEFHDIDLFGKKIEAHRLRIINDLNNTLGWFHSMSDTGKNKGRKKKFRGQEFKRYNGLPFRIERLDPTLIGQLLHKSLPPGVIKKETLHDIYILCPRHSERTASCAIGKRLGVVKCFGCGKSKSLDTFLSMTLGGTRNYRRWQLTSSLPIEKRRFPFQQPINPHQLTLQFPKNEE